MTHIYTACGTYDTLTQFAQRLLDAGINAIVTNSLMIYASTEQMSVLEKMISLSGLQVRPYDASKEKLAKSVDPKKNPVVRKMRRSW